MEDFEDNEQDIRKIQMEMLKTCIDDYIRLQWYPNRDKKYLHEIWLTSIGMIFDDTFLFNEVFKNAYGEPISTKEFIAQIMDHDTFHMSELRNYCVDNSYNYWLGKPTNTLHMPETLVVGGECWAVEQDSAGWIDFHEKYFYLDKTLGEPYQIELFRKIAEVLLYQCGITADASQTGNLGERIFMLIKMNNNFNKAEYS